MKSLASALARAGFHQKRASDAKHLRSMYSIPNPSHVCEPSSSCSTAGIARLAMTPKSCSLCGRPADVSAFVLVSTLQVSPRRQHSAKAIPFCNACLSTATGCKDSAVTATVIGALTTAWKALTRQSHELSQSQKVHSPDLQVGPTRSEPTSAVRPEASCRPCVTPCNSRQFDEPQKE